jgi:hypothetical protein
MRIPTSRNSQTLSKCAQNTNLSERSLKMLKDHTPSKLRVPGSNPGGVAKQNNILWLCLLTRMALREALGKRAALAGKVCRARLPV